VVFRDRNVLEWMVVVLRARWHAVTACFSP
jgi:hypothetical protein